MSNGYIPHHLMTSNDWHLLSAVIQTSFTSLILHFCSDKTTIIIWHIVEKRTKIESNHNVSSKVSCYWHYKLKHYCWNEQQITKNCPFTNTAMCFFADATMRSETYNPGWLYSATIIWRAVSTDSMKMCGKIDCFYEKHTTCNSIGGSVIMTY